MESWNAQMMLDKYIYNYLVTKGLHKTAEVFSIEANVVNPTNVEGYLMEWWDGFYDIYNTYQDEKAQLSYVKVLPKLFQVKFIFSMII
ncbi:transcriptional corepressor LEUNIG_HOMOLOG-like [Capsicum annuum]|uniref:transcriptional corepressor LEUNIG_HOMOLOG-like n=1 Tax=Capsicum annuum TaxID=4072 RepID=UPI001FB0D50D|nr:transcriptional corepressor LEUNIG_HOMOLOG-like [Capsicum annuum]